MKVLVFDTETAGKVDFKIGLAHPAQPNIVQLGAILFESNTGQELAVINLLNSECGPIEQGAQDTHGITEAGAKLYGVPALCILMLFNNLVLTADRVVCHNSGFDIRAMRTMALRYKKPDRTTERELFCTMLASTEICKLPSKYKKGGYKWPSLLEAHEHFIGESFAGAHDALADVRATVNIYQALPAEAKIKSNFAL